MLCIVMREERLREGREGREEGEGQGEGWEVEVVRWLDPTLAHWDGRSRPYTPMQHRCNTLSTVDQQSEMPTRPARITQEGELILALSLPTPCPSHFAALTPVASASSLSPSSTSPSAPPSETSSSTSPAPSSVSSPPPLALD